MAVEKFKNGTVKVDRVAKSKLSWYPRSRSNDVIAIDFGTSTLAVAYRVGDEEVKDLPIQRVHNVPSVLLIKPDKSTGVLMTAIGIDALKQYSKKMIDISKCLFFDKVKLELQHNQVKFMIIMLL